MRTRKLLVDEDYIYVIQAFHFIQSFFVQALVGMNSL